MVGVVTDVSSKTEVMLVSEAEEREEERRAALPLDFNTERNLQSHEQSHDQTPYVT